MAVSHLFTLSFLFFLQSNANHIFNFFLNYPSQIFSTKVCWKKHIYYQQHNIKTKCWIHFKSKSQSLFLQKQPPKGVSRKRCSENMQQIYRRTPMPKCDFNKVAKQLNWNHTWTWVFSSKCASYLLTEHLFLRTPLDSCFW